MTAGHALLAFGIASLVALLELVTSQYPRTFRLFAGKSWALWTYGAIYGLISAGFTLAYPKLAEQGVVRVMAPAEGGDQAVDTSAAWLVAVLLGISTKALLNIRLFSVPTGNNQMFPIGTETLTKLYEPELLRTIQYDDWLAVMKYLAPFVAAYPDLADVKKRIQNGIPSTLDSERRAAFITDIERAASPAVALERYLRAFGTKLLREIFPRPTPRPPSPPSPPPPPYMPPERPQPDRP